MFCIIEYQKDIKKVESLDKKNTKHNTKDEVTATTFEFRYKSKL